MNKFLLIILAILGLSQVGYSQIDTTNLALNAKIHLYSTLQNRILDKNHLASFWERRIEVEFLESTGFQEVVFFKITSECLTEVEINGTIRKIPIPFPYENDSYVFAYVDRGFLLFKIAGFVDNDILEFFDFVTFHHLVPCGEKWLYNPKKINLCISIEGVDLKKLVKNEMR
jgi:hypothetical protein